MTASPLDKIELRGFKSIEKMELALTSINVLIGANGAGKTNFLSFFRMLSAIVDGRLQNYIASQGGANAVLYNGPKQTTEIHAKLTFGKNLYDVTLKVDASDALYFSDEISSYWNRNHIDPYRVSHGGGHRETKLSLSSSPVAKFVREKISSWRLYHFHDTSPLAGVKQTGNIDDNEKLSEDARNLAAFLLLLRDRFEQNYRQIIDVVRLAAPFFQDFVLRASPRNESKIKLEWKQVRSENVFGPNDLSDGTLRFACLATALLQPNPPATMLIDEPELGLHPYAITLLAGLIRSAARRMQVIVSTQSVPLVNLFEPEEIVVVDRHDMGSTFSRLDPGEVTRWLVDYGLGDLWEKNVIGGRPAHA